MTDSDMQHWRKVKIKEFASIEGGGTPSRKVAEYFGGDIPWLSPRDLAGHVGRFVHRGAENLTRLGLENSSARMLPTNTVLFSSRATIGRVALAANPIATSQGFRSLVCDEEVAFPCYVYYAIQHYTSAIEAIASGATYKEISGSDLAEIEMYLPPLPTQHKIAAMLAAYDDLIENNTRRIAILEEMAQMLYREWFVHFRFPGHEKADMVDSKLGTIPQGWRIANLSELVSTQYGYTESATQEPIGPKFVRGTDINKTTFIQWETVPYCPIEEPKYAKYELFPGDVLVVRMATPGKVGIVEERRRAVFASYLIRLKVESGELSPYYLFYTLMSHRYQGYITGASTGTTRKSASAGVITDFDILIPPDALRHQFEERVSVLRQSLNNLLRRNAVLRQARDLLLPRLIGGELSISGLAIEAVEDRENA